MAIAAAATVLFTWTTPSLAQNVAQGLFSGTPQEQAACRRDVRAFCRHIKAGAGNDAFLHCLQEHRVRLNKACAEVLRSHGV